MDKEDIVKYLTEKGYPVSTGGDIPTFEEAMKGTMKKNLKMDARRILHLKRQGWS